MTWANNMQINTNFVYYELGFFGALFGVLFSLMSYNLQKMYGIDKIINEWTTDWLFWFITPGASIMDEIKSEGAS